jgi:nicotinate-nucleotide adenylyltransferase
MKKKIGLYMGSFNPVHIGHLIVANTVLDKTDLDEVWFVISPMSPDKQNMNLVHHDERFKILREALTDNNQLQVSNIEFDMEQPNYTYKTLEKLRKKYPNNEFGIIMGSDNANGLKQWVGVEHWQEHHKLYVVERPNSYLERGSLRWYGQDRYHVIGMPEIGISSTIIRQKVKDKESINYLVPKECISRIEFHYGTKKNSVITL